MEINKLDPLLISHLISKSLLSKLSMSEKIQLEEWIHADEQNKKMYESYKDSHALKPDIDFFHDINLRSAWDSMQEKIRIDGQEKLAEKSKVFFLRSYHKVAKIAAVLVLISTISLFTLQINKNSGIIKDSTGQYNNDILPGSYHAKLTRSNGKIVLLTDKEGEFIEQDGTQINSSSGMVNYLVDFKDKELITDNYNTISVPKGGNYKITLVDGTKVWLNSESEMQFPTNFSNATRKVILTGEAYFEVSRNKEKPFMVEVDGGMVEVLGTHFNVNASKKDIKTTLVEGSVKLVSATGEYTILKPGQLGNINLNDISVKEADMRKMLAWKNNEFYFKADPFSVVMNQVAAWYNVEVKMDKSIENVKISGSISKNVNLSEMLSMLKYITTANYKLDERILTITPKTNKK